LVEKRGLPRKKREEIISQASRGIKRKTKKPDELVSGRRGNLGKGTMLGG